MAAQEAGKEDGSGEYQEEAHGQQVGYEAALGGGEVEKGCDKAGRRGEKGEDGVAGASGLGVGMGEGADEHHADEEGEPAIPERAIGEVAEDGEGNGERGGDEEDVGEDARQDVARFVGAELDAADPGVGEALSDGGEQPGATEEGGEDADGSEGAAEGDEGRIDEEGEAEEGVCEAVLLSFPVGASLEFV